MSGQVREKGAASGTAVQSTILSIIIIIIEMMMMMMMTVVLMIRDIVRTGGAPIPYLLGAFSCYHSSYSWI